VPAIERLSEASPEPLSELISELPEAAPAPAIEPLLAPFAKPEPPPEPPPEPATTADLEPRSSRNAYQAPPPPEDPFAQYQSPSWQDGEGTSRAESPFATPGQELGALEPEPTPAAPMSMAMSPVDVSNPAISRPFLEDSLPRFSSDPSEPLGPQDDNPDATRVAAIPQELLDALPSADLYANVEFPTPEQNDAATQTIADGWNEVAG